MREAALRRDGAWPESRAVASVDCDAITANAAELRSRLAPDVRICAVVKADGYGHGAVRAARAALAGGATWLAVATATEAGWLRAGGLTAPPILVLGPLAPAELEVALAARADIVAWDPEFVATLPAEARVHVKLDTGMGRYGTPDPRAASEVAEAAGSRLVGAMTHFATADVPGDQLFDQQLERFGAWVADLKSRHPRVIAHAANSAASLRSGRSHHDMVRCGIALYGIDPFHVDASAHGLRPALELRSRIALVKRVPPGRSVGYGGRFRPRRPTSIATVPIGYGDGISRRLSESGGAILVRGHAYPLVGAMSMDALTIDLGAETAVRVGDPAIVIGPGMPAERIAALTGTIAYEVTTSLSRRIERAELPPQGRAPHSRAE